MVNRISAGAFVTWMVTQPNRNGTLYLERVVWHYVRSLRSVPLKLDVSLPDVERDVFACKTTAEFERLCQAFTAAPNFKEVDYNNSHSSFSAGLRCYKRYLEHLACEGNDINKNEGTTSSENDYEIDNITVAIIDLVLAECYANGFRLGSFIETERLRKFVNKKLTAPLTTTDDELESHVKNCGIVFGGKVYFVNAKTKATIKLLAEDYFAGGASVIFYESLFANC